MKQKLWMLCAWLLIGPALAQEPPVVQNKTPAMRRAEQAEAENALLKAENEALKRKQAQVQPSLIDNRYQPLGDGAQIKDTKTGLIWQRCAVGMRWNGQTCTGTQKTFNFDAAQKLAANGWRVPDKDELLIIVDEAVNEPAINRKAFPATPSVWFWSSSPYAGSSGFAWSVDFGNGLVDNFNLRFNSSAVRLVRAGQ